MVRGAAVDGGMMVWDDKVRSCVKWREGDPARLAQLRAWVDSEREAIIEELAESLIELNGARTRKSNARLVRRLQDVLGQWLLGLTDVAFEGDDNDRAERRRAVGRKLAHVNLTFEDVTVMEAIAEERLFAMAWRRLGDEPERLALMMQALSKAMTYDRAFVHAGCLDLHDAELEQALLDRFLTVTGFSPSLYESLAEAWRWTQERLGQREF